MIKRDADGAAIQVGETNSFISFQKAAEYVPPVWPAEPGEQPMMMMHIDVAVDDLDAAVAAQELGATLAKYQPQEHCIVLADPAGHPFCLYQDEE